MTRAVLQALALYAYAAERVFRRPCRRVELHHLPTGAVAAHEHTAESIERHVRRAEAIARRHRGRPSARSPRARIRTPLSPRRRADSVAGASTGQDCPGGGGGRPSRNRGPRWTVSSRTSRRSRRLIRLDNPGCLGRRPPRRLSWCHGGRRRAVSSGAAALGRSFVGGGPLLARGAEPPVGHFGFVDREPVGG